MHQKIKQIITVILVAFLFFTSIAAPAGQAACLEATPSGVSQKTPDSCIDYGHAEDGYVMVRYTGKTNKKIRARVTKGKASYVFALKPGSDSWTTIPLSEGNGTYTIEICKNHTGNKYYIDQKVKVSVEMEDALAPFRRSNTMVNYAAAPKSVEKAAELTAGCTSAKEKADAIQAYFTANMTYDCSKAESMMEKGCYIPDLDNTLEINSGICCDFASLMCGMLRSQGVPAKMEYGFYAREYHAWVMVYLGETAGWVRYDPTFMIYAANEDYNLDQATISMSKKYATTKTY